MKAENIRNNQILITGARGFVGSALMEHFKGAVPAASVRIESDNGASESLTELIRDLIVSGKIKVIINTAAISDIGVCENNPEESYRANVLLPVLLAKLSAEYGIKLICFSSDQVYSALDEEGPYTEDMVCLATFNMLQDKALSVYAHHKLEMEEKVLCVCPDAVILRAEWMYGYESPKSNYYLNVLNPNVKLSFSKAQYRGLAYVKEVAEQMDKCIRLPGGIYNFGSETKKNMYEITEEFLRYTRTEKELTEGAQRHNLWMNTAKAKSYGIDFSEVSAALEKCFADDAGLAADTCFADDKCPAGKDIMDKSRKSVVIVFSKDNISCAGDAYDLLKEQLNFPDYFGNNLDALYDCLCEISSPAAIIVKDRELICEKDEKMACLFNVLEDAAVVNANLTLNIIV